MLEPLDYLEVLGEVQVSGLEAFVDMLGDHLGVYLYEDHASPEVSAFRWLKRMASFSMMLLVA